MDMVQKLGPYILQGIMVACPNSFSEEPKAVSEPSLGDCITAEWERMMDTSEEHKSQLAFTRSKTTLEVRALGHMLSILGLCPEIF